MGGVWDSVGWLWEVDGGPASIMDADVRCAAAAMLTVVGGAEV